MLTKNINYDTRAYNQFKGYVDTPIIIDYSKYIDLFLTLKEYFDRPYYRYSFNNNPSTKKEELRRAKEYLSIYDLHKIYKSGFTLWPTLLFDKNVTYDKLIRYIKRSCVATDPLKLKIEYGYTKGAVKEAEVRFVNYQKLSNDKIEFLRKCPIVFESIKLSDSFTEESGSKYASLICETQASSRKSITNYSDKDVIRIFTELHYRKELLKNDALVTKYIDDKISSIYKIMIEMSSKPVCDLETRVYAIETSMEIVSFIKALMLFEKYDNSSNILEKKKIISEIQQVFDGKTTLEKMLEYNGITFNQEEAIKTIHEIKRVFTISTQR